MESMINRRLFLKSAATGVATFFAPGALRSAIGKQGKRRPNVLIILTDDQGYGDLSCHGNPVLRTPNLDKLHAQSIRLTDFHVAPKCTPTRGQLMTGCDALRNGASRVCQGRSMMRESLPTMADIFRSGGYRTGHFGKWHLGDSYPHRPQDRGFDRTVHHGAWGITSIADYYANDYWDDVYRRDDNLLKYEGYCTDVWFDQAMQWMQARQNADQPFFCYLAANCPHAPNWAPEKFIKPYANKKGPADFYGQIANIDMNMGRLMKWMSQRGLAENTILIFMGDNGSSRGADVFNAGMRGNKGTLWEGGHRVPCFIRWPEGELGSPRDIGELTQVQDILPTLIDMCSLRAGNRASERFDGTSLADLLQGSRDELDDRMLVVQVGAHPKKGAAAVMWNKWRMVNGKLYDIRKDPHQDTDVADRHPEVLAAMEKHYDKWWQAVQKPFAETRWIHLGSDKANPTTLYSSDWQGDYADNRGNLIEGDKKGYWNVRVERDGLYEFTLYRWWPHSDKRLTEAMHGDTTRGRGAVPIASAGLTIGDVKLKADAPRDKEGAKSVSFTAPLKRGEYRLQTMFYDKNGKELCSAYYTRVERK